MTAKEVDVSESLTAAAPLSLHASAALSRVADGCDAMSATADRVIDSDRLVDGEYPAFGAEASGAYVTDVDGNRYLDFLCAYGTIILGHQHPDVDAAVIAEIRRGFAVSMPKPLRVELTRRLVELVPGGELAVLLKSGSDATGAAVRLARAFTGRDVILRWGYNGWHDWCAVKRLGIPTDVSLRTDTFDYGSIGSVEAAFARHPGSVAAIIMMPFETEQPDPEFLLAAREIAHRNGALFLLDEIRSGFRMAVGGAQEALGVRADLVTVGKALANGYAISAVVGRRDVMLTFGDVHVSSTYYANSLAMAAALSTLDVLTGTDALDRVAALGRRLQEGLRAIVADHALPASVVGVPQMPFLRFHDERAKQTFFTGTVRRGIYFHPNHHWYVNAAMAEPDIDAALAAARAAAIEAGGELGHA
jgi:glutamate-1-semialdehyde aminotransferase